MDLSSIYQVLKIINTYIDPKAVIAGGAALDIPNGIEPNDVDIYFSSPFQFNVGAYGLLKATFKREMDLDVERTHNTRYCAIGKNDLEADMKTLEHEFCPETN